MIDAVATAAVRRCLGVRCAAPPSTAANNSATAGTTIPLSLLITASTDTAAMTGSRTPPFDVLHERSSERVRWPTSSSRHSPARTIGRSDVHVAAMNVNLETRNTAAMSSAKTLSGCTC